MSQTFKESWENFLSYVKLFAFLIVAGLAGYYFYNKWQEQKAAETVAAVQQQAAEATPTPVVIPKEITTEKPSAFVGPVMKENLPVLLDGFSEKPVEFLPSFVELEKLVAEQRVKTGKMQAAWNLAAQWCRQMRATMQARNDAAILLAQQNAPRERIASAIAQSPADLQAEQSKREFFAKAAAQRWQTTVPQRKKNLDVIYQQLLGAEKLAGR